MWTAAAPLKWRSSSVLLVDGCMIQRQHPDSSNTTCCRPCSCKRTCNSTKRICCMYSLKEQFSECLKEDLYSLSKHYFSHLSDRIDLLTVGLNIMRGEGSQPSSMQNSHNLCKFQQVTENDEEDYKIEQPHSSRKPETLQLAHCSPTPSESTTCEAEPEGSRKVFESMQADGVALGQLLDAMVMKVELGMLEMESRLKRNFAGLPEDGSMPDLKTHKPAGNPTGSQDMAFSRAGLFKSVYGDGKGKRRSRKVATQGMAQLAFTEGMKRRAEDMERVISS